MIEGSRLVALHNRAKDAIESGKFHLIDGMLVDFANDLHAALSFERQNGALKVMTADTEVKRCAAAAGLLPEIHLERPSHAHARRMPHDGRPAHRKRWV